jgi:hypothetical protein
VFPDLAAMPDRRGTWEVVTRQSENMANVPEQDKWMVVLISSRCVKDGINLKEAQFCA